MNALDIVEKALSDIEKGAIAASTYTDDMIFSGPVPQPLNREQYLGLMKGITAGVPDWNFHAHNLVVQGDTVQVNIKITGRQTRTLPGLMPGMFALPPTNKHFTLPGERLNITVRGDKISKIVAEVPPGGGVPGMLAQLGVTLPA